MHYDVAIACHSPLGSGDIGSHTRLLVEALASEGKRCVLFTGAAENVVPFADNPLVDCVVVEAPATTPYATVTGAEFRYAYALCSKLIEFLATHSIQTIEFPDRHAEGYFFINHNLVYRQIPCVVVRLHLPAFLIDDDNELPTRSLAQARLYAAEKEALHRADHIIHGGPAILERVLSYFTETEARLLRQRVVTIAPLTPSNFEITRARAAVAQPAGQLKKIGCLGPLEYRKGVDQLIIEAGRYFERTPTSTLRFYLIGDDTPTADGISFSAYLRRLVPVAAQTRFVFERPRIGHALRQQLGAMDAWVLPARFDHHPAALNDILPLGKPAFVSTHGDMPECATSCAQVRGFDPLSRAEWERVFNELENPSHEPTYVPQAARVPSQQEIIARYSMLPRVVIKAVAPVRITVVIPHLNDQENLTKLLLSLRDSKGRERIEIIVVDDGSPLEIVAALRAAFPEIVFLTTPHARSGPLLARKIGAEHAACDHVMFVDADDHIDLECYLHYAQVLAQTDRLDVLIPAMRHFGNETHASLPQPKSIITVLFECYIYAGLIGKKTCLLKAFDDALSAATTSAHSEDWLVGMSLLFDGAQVGSVLDCAYFYNRTRAHTRSLENPFMLWQSTAIRGRHFDQLIERAIADKTLPASDVKLLRLVSLSTGPVKDNAPPSTRGNQVAWHTHFYRGLLSLIGNRRYAPKRNPAKTSAAATPVFRSTRPIGERPRLLFISQVLPSAEGNGPARRAFAVINALGATYDVSLLWIAHPAQLHATPVNLPEGCIDWRILPADAGNGRTLRWRRNLAARHPQLFERLFRQPADWTEQTPGRLRLAAALVAGERYNVVHAFRIVMAPYALAVHTATGSCSVQLDTDDIESSTLVRIAELHRKNGEHIDAEKLHAKARAYLRLERAIFPRFNKVFVCSQTDATRLAPAHANIHVLPNVMPLAAALPAAKVRAGPFRFLFLGTLDYLPNSDALLWFCREIFPAIRASLSCELVVAGLNAPPALSDFLKQQNSVNFLGAVAQSATAFAAADAMVVPLRAGGGTRLKIIEAFAQGVPVISTGIGIEGIEAKPELHFLLADTPEAFTHAAHRLASDASLRSQLAQNAFELASRLYSPAALARTFTADIT